MQRPKARSDYTKSAAESAVGLCREHSPLGEASLYGWSQVLQGSPNGECSLACASVEMDLF